MTNNILSDKKNQKNSLWTFFSVVGTNSARGDGLDFCLYRTASAFFRVFYQQKSEFFESPNFFPCASVATCSLTLKFWLPEKCIFGRKRSIFRTANLDNVKIWTQIRSVWAFSKAFSTTTHSKNGFMPIFRLYLECNCTPHSISALAFPSMFHHVPNNHHKELTESKLHLFSFKLEWLLQEPVYDNTKYKWC